LPEHGLGLSWKERPSHVWFADTVAPDVLEKMVKGEDAGSIKKAMSEHIAL
jgi:hypothetical protein